MRTPIALCSTVFLLALAACQAPRTDVATGEAVVAEDGYPVYHLEPLVVDVSRGDAAAAEVN